MKVSLKSLIVIVLIIALLFGIATYCLVKYSEKNMPEGEKSQTAITPNNRGGAITSNPNSPMGELKKYSGDELVKKIESLTDEEFITIAYKPNAEAISDLVELEVFDKELAEGEYWFTNPILTLGSSKSKEECETKLANLKDDKHSITYEYVGENDYYFEYTVTKTRSGSTLKNTSRYIILKDSIVEIPSVESNYTMKGATFKKIDEKTIKTVLDTEIAVDPEYVIYRFIDEENGEYVYTVYTSEVKNGEAGVDDEVSLIKTEYRVNKDTGLVEVSKEMLKENVKVEGTGEVL